MSESDAEEELIIVPIPALVALLVHLEQEKGSALTEAEVLAARDKAVCITMPRSTYQAFAEKRGYDDINPEHVWAEWLTFKATQSTGDA